MAQIKISINRGFYICRERTREGTQSLVVCESVGWRSEVGSEVSGGDGRKRFCDGDGPHAHPKLSGDQGGDDVVSDTELLNLSVFEEEDEDEYDQLPPFMPLKKSQIEELSKE
ncbi:hypothetical protein FH972_015387 [Carpinus fangiana]|uniref:Uncharacterized protein n=1 Tax=Carpinus fangiana TaxID=176857 RepID=A0A5N6RG00_9ROSI|nr:hypothetical protein FH972_015387 [Carpinus fangiana]